LDPIPEAGSDFEEPWQAYAWVMARALSDKGLFTLNEWSRRLGAKLRAREDDGTTAYYHAVLEALESLIVDKKAATPAELSKLKQAWREAYEHTPHGKPVELHR
jgi:nitrile hydratase accessory protein